MNKTQMINEIVRIYDENEELKRQIQQFKDGKPALTDEKNRNIQIDNEIVLIGRKEAFENIFSRYSGYWPTIRVKDGDGKMNFLSLEQWNKAIDTDLISSDYKYLLNTNTFGAIKDYFASEFKAKYEERLEEAKIEVLNEAKTTKN